MITTPPAGAPVGPRVATGAAEPTATGAGAERATCGALTVLVLALGLVASDGVQSPFFTPKAAVLLVAMGPGLVLLARRALTRDAAAITAVAFLAAAAVSTALAAQPALAFFGRANMGTGWLFLAALAAMWAIGAQVRRSVARRSIEHALLAVVLVNAALGILQCAGSDLGRDNVLLAAVDGRAVGLIGNAAILGPLVAVGAYLLAHRAATESRLSTLVAAGAVLVGAAMQVSGSRIAIGVAGVGLAFAFRADGRRTVMVSCLVVLGFAMVSVALPGSASGVNRSGASASDVRVRLDVWDAGLDALVTRPVFGWGPNQFLPATSARVSERVAASTGRNGNFTDAHDTVVELGVDTGVVGLGLAVAFVGLSARRARGPLAVCAVLLALPMLLEPWSVVLAPLALLALGAAGPDESPPPLPRAAVVVAGVLLVLGMLAGTRLLVGDAALRDARRDLDPAAARNAVALLPPWAEPELASMKAWSWRAVDGGSAADWNRALAAGRAATRKDPSNPQPWIALAGLEATRGDVAAARTHYRAALQRDPYNRVALTGLRRLATARTDTHP